MNKMTDVHKKAYWLFIDAFSSMLVPHMSDYMKGHGLSKTKACERIGEEAKRRAGQGNAKGVSNLVQADGWVDPRFATEVFRELLFSEDEIVTLGRAYTDLKMLMDGKVEKYHRDHPETGRPYRLVPVGNEQSSEAYRTHGDLL
jgi:hypothetical protein